MFPLHVLVIYAMKRIGGIQEADSIILQETRRRVLAAPVDQQNAVLADCRKNRAAVFEAGRKKGFREEVGPNQMFSTLGYLFLVPAIVIALFVGANYLGEWLGHP